MSWNFSEVILKPIGIFKRSDKETVEPSSTTLVNDYDDDLGVNSIETRRDVPFKRLESAVRKFTEVALPVNLERLKKHKINIIRFRSSEELLKLRVEYENSSHTVKEIIRNLTEMDALRARVLKDHLPTFDYHLTPAKTEAIEVIDDFLTLKEGLENIDKPPTPNFCTDATGSEARECPFSIMATDRRQVTVRGNQLFIENVTEEVPSECSLECAAPIRGQQVFVTEKPVLDQGWLELEKDIQELHRMMQTVSSIVHEQGKVVDDISSNVEKAGINIEKGNVQLRKATILKAAMFPIVGAVIGGPIGMLAGLKIGGVAVAAAGVTGSFVGYQGGKVLKKRHEDSNSFEMKPIQKRKHTDSDCSEGSFEMVHKDGDDKDT